MTRTNIIKMLTLAGVIAVGGMTMASARSGEQGAAFQELDANGDGQLTRAELKAHAAARFAASDTDGDGFLSGDEMFKERVGKRAERMLLRYDSDDDGKLDASELEAAAEARQQGRYARMLRRLDTNEDGKLSFKELSARRDTGKFFDRFDTDSSGGLSAEEFAKAREHRRGKRGH